jgi:hypothetical protein
VPGAPEATLPATPAVVQPAVLPVKPVPAVAVVLMLRALVLDDERWWRLCEGVG